MFKTVASPLLLLLLSFTAVVAVEADSNSMVLDLETAQQIALAENPTLAAAAERIEQALQQKEQARSLYFPRLDLDGGAGWSRLSESTVAGEAGQGSLQLDRNQERYQLSLGGSWVLFDGFARKFTNLIAEYGVQGSGLALRDGQRILLQLVAESYYNSHLFGYSIQIAEADMAFNEQQLQEAQIRYEQGAGPLSNVLNFRVQINRAKTDLLVAQRDYEVSLYTLATLLGYESGRLPAEVELAELEMIDAAAAVSPPFDELVLKAGQYRPDLLQLQLQLQQREAEVGRARAAYYPTIGVQGALSGEGSEDILLEEDDFGASIGLSLSYNLYRGGGDKARILESEAQRRETQRLYQDLKNQVTKEVRQARADLTLAQQQLELQRETTELVEQTRDLVRDGYNAGQESLVRLNEAQRDLVRTQSNLALALVGLYRFRFSLLTATGESVLLSLAETGNE